MLRNGVWCAQGEISSFFNLFPPADGLPKLWPELKVSFCANNIGCLCSRLAYLWRARGFPHRINHPESWYVGAVCFWIVNVCFSNGLSCTAVENMQYSEQCCFLLCRTSKFKQRAAEGEWWLYVAWGFFGVVFPPPPLLKLELANYYSSGKKGPWKASSTVQLSLLI